MEWPSLYPPYAPGDTTIPLPRRPDERELDETLPNDPGAYDSFNPNGTAASPAYNYNNGVYQWFLQAVNYDQEVESIWDDEGGTLITSKSARFFTFPCATEFVLVGGASKEKYLPNLWGTFPCLWPPNPPFGHWEYTENPLDTYAETAWQYWTELGASFPCGYITCWRVNAAWDLRFYRFPDVCGFPPVPPILALLLANRLKRRKTTN